MAKIRILNVDFESATTAELLREVQSGVVLPLNVDTVVHLQRDREYYDVCRGADYLLPDSQILVVASHLLGTPFPERVSGSDFFPAFCDHHAADESVKVFLLGAGPGVAAEAAKRTNQRVGRELVVGTHSPSYGFERDEAECARIVEIIDGSGANVLAVGVGAPKQEKWIARYRERLPRVRLFIAIGATLDFEAGRISRAPRWTQRVGLEWAYRLTREPGRLWRRYLVDDMRIFPLLLAQRLGRYRDPFAESGGGRS
jgi:N-acetylglucosaminyldiphosphoundecaprenol N-acetyl-beta-D-mannosaminyltransferase